MSTPPRNRPPGETSGSDQRPARDLSTAAMEFDIATELMTLQQEPSWQNGDRNARTLVEKSGFRMVLTALKMGARLKAHQTAGWVSLYAVTGNLRVLVDGRVVELPPNHALVLARNEPHEVEAVEDSSFLLTVAGLGQSET
jgi:quercetin dioxygenase-like cupin family protein